MRHKHIFLVLLAGLAYPVLAAEGSKLDVSAVISEIRSKLPGNEECKPAPWAALHRLTDKTSQNVRSEDQIFETINQALRSCPNHPRLVRDGSIDRVWQKANQVLWFSGVIGQRRGKFYYVHYIFPNSPADKQGLKRGDRLSIPVGLSAHEPKSLTLSVKQSPLTSEKSLSLTYEKSLLTTHLESFLNSSAQLFSQQDKSTVAYLHPLDCSAAAADAIYNHIDRYKSLPANILDLRHSHCQNSTKIQGLLSQKKFSKQRLYILSNRYTSSGAEDLIRALQNARNATVLGEQTAGLGSRFEWFKLSNVPYYLVTSTQTSPPITPDLMIKDSVIFSQGQDDLINVALSKITTH